ncbi:hypothetical protein J0910_19865 [Nocardiopsis sp. CNT-189]|uniref:hypothetical protein n=1 Tax=Nocardiopsis oceanisediminis TaxID=2816862 RepID=UPI003B300954
MRTDSATRAVAAFAAAGLLAAGCAPRGGEPEEGGESVPHGYVEGAEETAEAQWRLVMADPGGGLHMLDPATEEVGAVGEAPGAEHAATDGRFAYVGGDGGTAVFDSGTWTVDHGDHVHYYKAEARTVGEVGGGTGAWAAGDTALTVLGGGDRLRALDRAALEDGEVDEAAAAEGTAAVAYAGHLVTAGGSGGVAVLDRDGEPAGAGIGEDCPDPRGQAVTRRGAVLGCSDGALLLTEGGGEDAAIEAEKVPYPDGAGAGPAQGLYHRPGAPVLAGPADEGVWVLDVGAAEWTLLDTGPVLAASAAGEDMPVLVLGEDGALRSYDPATGEETAETELIEEPGGDGPPPAVAIDTARAYVNDPEGRAVYEIDYNDDLRTARTFELDFAPALMVETGW